MIVFGDIEDFLKLYLVKKPQFDRFQLRISLFRTPKPIKTPKSAYFYFHHPELNTKFYIKTRIRREEGGISLENGAF